jgi:hypothetical protein
MSINHCGSDIPVSQKLLDCPDVVAGFEEVCRERMAERVAGRAGGQAGFDHSVADGSLDEGFINMVASLLAGLRVPPPVFLGGRPTASAIHHPPRGIFGLVHRATGPDPSLPPGLAGVSP